MKDINSAQKKTILMKFFEVVQELLSKNWKKLNKNKCKKYFYLSICASHMKQVCAGYFFVLLLFKVVLIVVKQPVREEHEA